VKTQLSPEFQGTADGEAARDIMRKCVHCGFCNATCPTYQLLGDELDGPRGRIYLIKQVLEGAPVTRSTQQHLDRCLTCLNCQTTCPSGVEYGHLVDIGRRIVDEKVRRPVAEQAARVGLREGLTSPLFAPALRLAQAVRPLLPRALQDKVPPPDGGRAAAVRRATHPYRILLLQGCVQPGLLPNIDRATARVLDAAGIEILQAAGTGCCGALRTHLGEQDGGLDDMRRNIDAWLPILARGEVQAIVSSASACSLAIKGYGYALSGDEKYAAAAAQISEKARDLSELLPQIVPAIIGRMSLDGLQRLAFHPPCTLQHGQQLRGGIEYYLRTLGFDVELAGDESHLCCGSAGTYSILQPQLSRQLRDRKLHNLGKLGAQCIVSANVGCIQHLRSGTLTPVKHWIEVLEEHLMSEV